METETWLGMVLAMVAMTGAQVGEPIKIWQCTGDCIQLVGYSWIDLGRGGSSTILLYELAAARATFTFDQAGNR